MLMLELSPVCVGEWINAPKHVVSAPEQSQCLVCPFWATVETCWTPSVDVKLSGYRNTTVVSFS